MKNQHGHHRYRAPSDGEEDRQARQQQQARHQPRLNEARQPQPGQNQFRKSRSSLKYSRTSSIGRFRLLIGLVPCCPVGRLPAFFNRGFRTVAPPGRLPLGCHPRPMRCAVAAIARKLVAAPAQPQTIPSARAHRFAREPAYRCKTGGQLQAPSRVRGNV